MSSAEDIPSRRSQKNPNSNAASRPANGSNSTKKSASLPQETVEYLKSWMMSPEHIAHPYPTEQEKAQIMAETGIELKQLTNWFVNNRKRYWKPRVEAKLTSVDGKPAIVHGTNITTTASNAVLLPPPPLPSQHDVVQQPPQLAYEDPHTVSEGGSVVSSSSATANGWCSEEDDSSFTGHFQNAFRAPSSSVFSVHRHGLDAAPLGSTLRREVVDVHILHPDGGGDADESGKDVLPTLRDVTIKSNVKKEMILATFPKCLLQYTVPEEIENDRKKVQTRRDGEVLRVKKHYLKLYLATRGIHSVSSPYGENPVDVAASGNIRNGVNHDSSSPAEITTASNHVPSQVENVMAEHESYLPKPDTCAPSRKRSLTCSDIKDPAPARKRRTSSDATNGEQEWRELCQNAKDIFCDSLPGLEEAAVMFGYATQ
eukprot:CCRYP_012173-RA/>CCRYP_012173-RA protein AED:0.12 eAED:0.12 QI:579/1/1/1/1/1/2/1677/427